MSGTIDPTGNEGAEGAAAEAAAEAPPAAEAAGAGSDTAPTIEQLQSELETWKGHARKHEDRAKANAAAAERVVELEAEAQKYQDLEKTIPAKVAEQLRTHLVTAHSIPEATAATLLTATDPETLLAQVNALQSLSPAGASAPLEGTRTSEGAVDAETTLVRSLFTTSD